MQVSQFTSLTFTELLKAHGIRIRIDGKGCWRDNVFVERLMIHSRIHRQAQKKRRSEDPRSDVPSAAFRSGNREDAQADVLADPDQRVLHLGVVEGGVG